MAAYFVGYDLRNPRRDYRALEDAIRTYGIYWRCLDSTWIVVTEKDASTIANHLLRHIDANDKLLVVELDSDWAASRSFGDGSLDWLRRKLAA